MPDCAPQLHASVGAHGGVGATRVTARLSDWVGLALGPESRWTIARLSIVSGAMVSTLRRRMSALLVTISACPRVPTAAALRHNQPCIVMTFDPSMDPSGGGGGGGRETGGVRHIVPTISGTVAADQ